MSSQATGGKHTGLWLLIQASHEYCAISSGVYRYGFDEDKTVEASPKTNKKLIPTWFMQKAV